MFITCRKKCRILLASPVLVLVTKGEDKVDEDDAGVVGDVELFVVFAKSVVFVRNRTAGVWIG